MAKQQMRAEIPFAFHAQSSALPAGNYEVSIMSELGGMNVLKLRNSDNHKTVMTMPLPGHSGKLVADPNCLFRCGDNGCTLRSVRFPSRTYDYAAPRGQRAGEHLTSISLRSVNAD